MFFQKGVGDPNPSTVRQMSFFRGTISKKIVFFAFFYRILIKRAPWPSEAAIDWTTFDLSLILIIFLLINPGKTIIIRIMDKKIFLKELKDLLVANFGDDINDVILFGSQVTGKATEDSDYDVLIVLNNEYDWEYEDKITSVLLSMELEHDIFIDTKIISVSELHNTIKGIEPLYVGAIQEGIHA